MVNIGLLGDVNAPKTELLRMLVRYINIGRLEQIKGGIKCSVVKTDFSGEPTTAPESRQNCEIPGSMTVHPNRVVFREMESGKNHSLFSPGGDKVRAVIKMGIITISRIATRILAVFHGRHLRDALGKRPHLHRSFRLRGLRAPASCGGSPLPGQNTRRCSPPVRCEIQPAPRPCPAPLRVPRVPTSL